MISILSRFFSIFHYISEYIFTLSFAMQAILHTNKWPIRLELHADKTPFTVANFITLASQWYYDNLTFHRVIEDFMIQGWCPDWTGAGWPWYQFDDEFHEELRHDGPGILSMANSGPWTNGSQFFITHIETPWLDGKHTVFWRVVGAEDLEIVNNIRQNDLIERIEISGDQEALRETTGDFITQLEEMLAYVAMVKAWWWGGCCGGHCDSHSDKKEKEEGCCGGGCGC